MARGIDIAPDEFYHVYNRGTEKRDIFVSDRDYERFLGLLYTCNGSKPVDLKLQGSTLYQFLGADRGDSLIDIAAYVLMPNHFHLLVRSRQEGDVSKFMQKLATGYTMYFNTKSGRMGALFQGRFKAKHIHSDEYLAYLISYIHLNPVKLIEPSWKEQGISDKKRAEMFLQQYRWSSYRDFVETGRPERVILQKKALPEYWQDPRSFEVFVTDWLSYEESNEFSRKSVMDSKKYAAVLI